MMARANLAILSLLTVMVCSNTASAQITTPRTLSASTDQLATLQEFLINRLRATTEERKAYVRRVVELVRTGKLETKLVLAIYRHAIKKNPTFPLPFFERALKVEAGKRGVAVPTIRQFLSTKTR